MIYNSCTHLHKKAILVIFTLCLSPLMALSPIDRFQLSDQGKAADATMHKLDGKKTQLSHYKGKYVLLTFWATWCRACVFEMPSLEKLAQQFKHDNIAFVAITRPYPSQTTQMVQAYRRTNGLMSLDFTEDSSTKETPARLHAAFNITSLPTAILLDPRGHIIGRLDGAVQWDHKDFIRFFQELIDGKVKPNHSPSKSPSLWDSFVGFFR
ncbi:MAG: TlpA family protein disulfide reductase [Alphaproteobacteria bacterium]|nr:MAG: TlpA family protein disulfide reductase [Alphaproteobacteria bacterium]